MASSTEGSDVCMIPQRKNQAAADIGGALSLLSSKKSAKTSSKKESTNKWLQSEVKMVLSNKLTETLSVELRSQERKYYLVQTKYGSTTTTETVQIKKTESMAVEELLEQLSKSGSGGSTAAAQQQLLEIQAARKAELAQIQSQLAMKERECQKMANEGVTISGGDGGSGGDGVASAKLQAENARLKAEVAEQKHTYDDNINKKDRMLNEVKDALKTLGLRIGNLNSKTAIPKLRALLSILTKQVSEYKGRQRELQQELKSRTNEVAHLKTKLEASN